MRALTVAYRGNFQPGVSHPWSTETHVAAALEALGHRVVRLQENKISWADCEIAGRAADMFLWQRTWDIDPAGGHHTLGVLKAAGVPTVSFHLDLYIGLEREAQLADDPFWRTALVVTADGGHDDQFAAYGINHRWLPPAVAEEECILGEADHRRFPHPVVFVGSHPYPHPGWRPYRDRLISTLTRRYRSDFRVWPDRGRPIRGRALADLYASAAVVIGDSCLAGQVPRYWSDRTPECLGRGGFLIHPEVDGMEDWYVPGWDFATYPVGDFDALCAHVDHYLAAPDERARIAAQGRATVVDRDTYRHRMVAVLDTVGAELGFPARPSAGSVTVRHRRLRQAATFELEDGDSDAVAIAEVWKTDDYHLDKAKIAGGTVVDVGANVGAFTVLAAKLGAATIHAYEPHPGNRARLEQNVAANGVGDRVVIHDQAVMDGPGKVWITGSGGGVHVDEPNDGPCVEAVGLDDVLADLDDVAFLKVDVEGSEYPIFAGVDGEILNRVRTIALEFHGPGMPHLTHLDADGGHAARWGAMIAKLANYGRVEIFGRPMVGGIAHWRRY